jgi:cyclic pyranopterin phosphate synthase
MRTKEHVNRNVETTGPAASRPFPRLASFPLSTAQSLRHVAGVHASVEDQLGRPLRDLRISVTDRCNFRCTYCMPRDLFGEGYSFLPRASILTFEEITRVAQAFTQLGVEKLRLTGGEPLLRRALEQLVAMLVSVDGVRDIALTTNGAFLAQKAGALRDAGLHRLTVSVDSLKQSTFAAMNDVDFPVRRVLDGIDAALAAGFQPIKINVVIKRGVNDNEVVDIVRHFSGPEYVVRFIEFMDVGNSNGWRMRDVVPASEIVAQIAREIPLTPLPSNYRGEVARRFRLATGAEIGLIASVTQPFCADCSRARLSADGRLYTCLFSGTGVDLRALVRESTDNAALIERIKNVWGARADRYSELRGSGGAAPASKAEMSLLGG